MSTNRVSSKITPTHLSRKAVVYLRQSSEQQVQMNTESRRLQYALVDRAQELGFARVEVIDQDLGLSASVGAKQRPGFQALIASIVLGEVGLVLSRELSRLSRTDKDWCQLQEVCQVFGVLLGDSEQVYDLSLMDDQLVLGVKGTMSVLELNVLKLRLQEGMQAKARRGELIRLLPPGYVRDGEGKVVKDPDTRVREAIELIFATFRTAHSMRQTHLWFHSQGVELPVNKRRGEHMRIVWQLPSRALVSGVLHNPFYAGAYVWGQRPSEMKWVDDRLVRRASAPRPPKDCKVFIRDHHEAYICWKEYEENLRRMRGNNLRLDAEASVAAARGGQGLLTRLLRCGRCGRKLHVRYWGRGGTAARYACLGDYHQGGNYCLAFGGSTVDKRFSEELLKVISPLGTRASLEALERQAQPQAEARQALQRQLQEAEYSARRAFEQYDEADPRNRLVAAQLEQRWNAKLEEVETLSAQLAAHDIRQEPLTQRQQEIILELGERFAEVWHSDDCPSVLKKKIMRAVIEEVIVDEDEASRQLVFTVHWKGGVHTRFEMPKPPSGVGRKTAMEDLEIIRAMAVRYGDDQIARVLTKLKRRTATGKRWNSLRVTSVRARYKISGQRRSTPDPDVLSLAQAARYGGVSDTTIRRLVEADLLDNQQVVPWAPWEIQRADLHAEPVRSILSRVRDTGKLDLQGDRSADQPSLFSQSDREEHTQVS
jgi:DNA invertase Pin-like site-specific DNA recombinase